MNTTFTKLLAFVWIWILVCTLFILTKGVIKIIPPLFVAIKTWNSRGFKDILLLIILVLLLWLFVYDWWIFFYKMYFLVFNG
jgi:hypothetical protein